MIPRYLHYVLIISLMLLYSYVHATDLNDIENELSDTVITAKITAKLMQDKELNPLKLTASTQQGIVTLSGYVHNKQAFVKALRLVKSTKGVKEVNTDDLEIKKVNTAFTDAYITAKVEAAILKAKVLDDESIPLVGINASTTNGVVTLTGHLQRNQSITAIIKRVHGVRGVKKIVSHLQINPTS